MKTTPPSMRRDFMPFFVSTPHRMGSGKACHPESPGFRRGLFVCPRSPGWQPGDTGHENHPAIHAARLHAIARGDARYASFSSAVMAAS
jgi:hypothetical protein